MGEIAEMVSILDPNNHIENGKLDVNEIGMGQRKTGGWFGSVVFIEYRMLFIWVNRFPAQFYYSKHNVINIEEPKANIFGIDLMIVNNDNAP